MFTAVLNEQVAFRKSRYAGATGRSANIHLRPQISLKLYDAAGLDVATSHSGRRTFIATLASKGVNVRVLAELAGHSNISTTQRYIHINGGVLGQVVEAV